MKLQTPYSRKPRNLVLTQNDGMISMAPRFRMLACILRGLWDEMVPEKNSDVKRSFYVRPV